MNHGMKHRHLGRDSAHRKALFTNLLKSIIEHEQIKTTTPKAKELRVIADKIITLAKKDDLSAKKEAFARLQNKELVKKLFDVLKERYKSRNGGYTRLIKAGFRKGDSAEMSVIEFVDRDESAKGKRDLELLSKKETTEEK